MAIYGGSLLRSHFARYRRCARASSLFASSPSASIVVGDGGALIVLRHNNNCANDRARKALRNRRGRDDPFRLFSPFLKVTTNQRDKTSRSRERKEKRQRSYKLKRHTRERAR